MLSEEGILTVPNDQQNIRAAYSGPNIGRGWSAMRESEELVSLLGSELRRAVQQRFKRVDLDRFKQEIRKIITLFLFEQTGRSPIVIPVVGSVGGGGTKNFKNKRPPTPIGETADLKRFQEMRALLNRK